MNRVVLALVALGIALVVVACQPRATVEATIAGERWTLLEGGQDGMRGLGGFGSADGMLFAFDREIDPAYLWFVMDEVTFPLAIAWFDGDGALIETATMSTCLDSPCESYRPSRPYRWAVEAPVGAFDDLPSDALLDVRDD